MQTTTLELPSWMASALINGDTSGIDHEDDENKLEEVFQYCLEHKLTIVSVSEESKLRNYPSLDSQQIYGERLGGDYSSYTAYFSPKP